MGAANHLSVNLRNLRASKSLSINRFAHLIGVSRSTLHEIEQGHAPNLETLDCIARHLNLPPALLISDCLIPPQNDQFVLFLQTLDWYRSWSQPDQDEFVRLLTPLLIFLARHPANPE